jgi:uncharacterized protein (TIGR02246 family)
MKFNFLLIALTMITPGLAVAQGSILKDQQRQQIHALIDAYSKARAEQDTALMESILTGDIDQLTSSGEWRRGKAASMQGMGRSSASTPGTRVLKVESVRLLSPESGIVDARYDIQAPDGTTRNMWSTFMVVHSGGTWRISAIRNMFPTN